MRQAKSESHLVSAHLQAAKSNDFQRRKRVVEIHWQV